MKTSSFTNSFTNSLFALGIISLIVIFTLLVTNGKYIPRNIRNDLDKLEKRVEKLENVSSS